MRKIPVQDPAIPWLQPGVYRLSTDGADVAVVLWIDGAQLLVDDLAVATSTLYESNGLRVTTDGGRVHGPSNPVVPLRSGFLELVTDRVVPGWTVATDDFDGAVRRLGRPWQTIAWRCPDGSVLEQRAVVADRPELPVLVDGARTTSHPSMWPADHRASPLGITCLVVGCAVDDLRRWLGDDLSDLPLDVRDDPPGVLAVSLALAGSRILLEGSCRDDQYAV